MTSKVSNIVTDIIIVQGYESIKKGDVSLHGLLPNSSAILVNHVLFKDWLDARIPGWFGLDATKDKATIEWISTTIGLSGGFIVSDKLLGEKEGIKTSLMKSGLIATVKLIVNSVDLKSV